MSPIYIQYWIYGIYKIINSKFIRQSNNIPCEEETHIIYINYTFL